MFFQGNNKVSIPTATAIAKMLNQPEDRTKGRDGNNIVDVGGLESIIRQVSTKQSISEDLLALFPDMKFCAETVSLSIVSPNDMVTKNYNLNFNTLKLGNDLKGSLSALVKDDLNLYYKFNNNLPENIEEALFFKGSCPECYIPESSLSDIITDDKYKKVEAGDITVESFFKSTVKSKGIFNKTNNITAKDYKDVMLSVINEDKTRITEDKLTLESATVINLEKELGVEFTDNIGVLYSNFINDDITKKSISGLYKKSSNVELNTESGKPTNLKDEILKIFKNPGSLKEEKLLNIDSYTDGSRKSLGRPLYIKLDPVSVKPIWSITPDNHLGYLVLLDENGKLINSKDYNQQGLDNNNAIGFSSNSKTVSDGILNRAFSGLKSMTDEHKDLDNMEEIYGSILHNTIVKKISEGKLRNVGNLSKDQNFLRLMFNRALKGKKTKVIYLPVDVVSYFAYEYKENGMGLSRLEKISVLMSMRAIMLFAKLMANIKNSIPITEVEATIDSKEPDVKAAMNKIISATLKNHQVSLPIGTADVNSLVQWAHNLGYVYNITSDRLPDTKVKLNDSSRSIKIPEDTISEILEELCYMEFFMNAEMVKSGKESNFATTIITQNKLYENRIIKQQIKTEINATKKVKTILNNDAVLRNKMLDVILNNLKEIKKLNKDLLSLVTTNNIKDDELSEVLLELLIDDIEVSFPRPTSLSEGDNLSKSLKDYKEAINDYVDTLFESEAYSAAFAGEEISSNIETYKAIIKKMLLQEWVNENNFIPSMSKFLTLDDSGQSLNNLFSQYTDTMQTFATLVKDFLKVNKKKVDKLDNDINKLNDNGEEMEPGDGEDESNLDGGDISETDGDDVGNESTENDTEDKTDNETKPEEKSDDKKEEDEDFEFDLDKK